MRTRVDLEVIKRIVCEKYNIETSRLFMKGRKRDVVEARQAFAYLAYSINNDLGYESLGKHMNLNHATVLHACNQVRGFMEVDKYYHAEISELYKECLKYNIEVDLEEEINMELVVELNDKLLNCQTKLELKKLLIQILNKL